MAFSDDELRSLVNDPKESLGTEIKQWIDPNEAAGEAKIAKACIALRNNNGGCLIIGFDKTWKPTDEGKPADIRQAYRLDLIQGIVNKYAGTLFEISVSFIERDGTEYPVITVESGVESPVATKRDLQHPEPNEPPLIKQDTVYVRTLQSNHTVSTAAANYKDFERVTKICFDNREADVGSFIRRHLATLDKDKIAFFSDASKPTPTVIDRVGEFMNFGKSRFEAELAEQKTELPTCGFREAAIVIDGEFAFDLSNKQSLWQLEASKPRHTGWTPWVDSSNASDPKQRPHVFKNGWEALIIDLGPKSFFGDMVDFWRIDFEGMFYALRGFEDDLPSNMGQKPKPNTVLDFYLQISRTAEVISVGLSFAQTMGCDPKSTNLAFKFRWSGLKGRQLTSWVVRERMFHGRGICHDNETESSVIVPMETPPSGIAPFVEKITDPLYVLFDGMKFERSVIEGIVQETLSRQF